MQKRMLSSLLAIAFMSLLATPADACSRILYETATNNYLVGRTMDWDEDAQPDLWAYPRGMVRTGGVGPGFIEWKSKYGSLTASFRDVLTAQGINEAGLVADGLSLFEAGYGDAKASKKPLLSGAGWIQFILDNYGSVAEAVRELEKEPFAIVAPDDYRAGIHAAISDPSGDSAVLEYIKGRLVIHHDRKYTVMTNSPPFDQQLAINTYWNEIGGSTFLPGTHRAADRFARLSWNLKTTPKVKDPQLAAATVFSLIRMISVPLGIVSAKELAATTQWRSVVDTGAKRYFFERVLTPSVFWVDLEKLKLEPGSKPSKLELTRYPVLAGEVSDKFVPADPFKILAP